MEVGSLSSKTGLAVVSKSSSSSSSIRLGLVRNSNDALRFGGGVVVSSSFGTAGVAINVLVSEKRSPDSNSVGSSLICWKNEQKIRKT